ncbi:hypothetical protein TEA_007130 [Camellia sinensis var. sinensis]|uniref:Peptide N-acetyl-beta-D-glucosaminyl asparaginase amidase A N-terminal domain-containing protein n=1 Tax=Camellia sinensis var. sinensis TaxID=542762 RepID=A0A4V3WLA8_CAMSN|nr:hypothetical protein TEA_007130 [Camellia sinensis var. sinensis]
MSLSLLLLLTLSLLSTNPLSLSSTANPPDRFIKSIPPHQSLRHSKPQEYIELTHPLPSDHLIPSFSLQILHHYFADTIGRPPISAPYSPPSACPPPWSSVVLHLQASSYGDQYDRIAAIWLAGAEILRTSTAEPTPDGVFWNVRKDVTRYVSLLQRSNLTLTVMLENVVNDVFTGVYDVRLTLLYYKSNPVRVLSSADHHHNKLSRKLGLLKDYRCVDSKLGFESEKFRDNTVIVHEEKQRNSLNLYETPADLIIPISNVVENEGFWFRIESESGVRSKGVKIPPNTYKAVLEIYVSFHGNDEFWYSNPPDSYIRMNNLTTGRGHGAYREVFATIDGSFVGSVIPFPIIFTGGINPLFWEPVVAIGAFNVPSYDFDLTPFLGLVLDCKTHLFGLGVADSIPFWLVDANLHLWLSHGSSAINAKSVHTHTPSLSIKRSSVFDQLDGSFEIRAKRTSRFLGWVKSNEGNLTTHVLHHLNFKNSIRFERNGTYKLVRQKVKTKTEVKVESEMGLLIGRVRIKRRYPLRVITSTLPGSRSNVYKMVTNVSHSLTEKLSCGCFSRSLRNSQDSRGWMVVKDHDVLSGSANTDQSFSYMDEFGCYSRVVSATDGKLVSDNMTFSCPSSF